MSDTLAGDLRRYIYQAYYDGGGPGGGSHWVMSPEWLCEIRKLHDNDGRAVWEPSVISGPLRLLGLPVEIREDGGVPRLEPDR